MKTAVKLGAWVEKCASDEYLHSTFLPFQSRLDSDDVYEDAEKGSVILCLPLFVNAKSECGRKAWKFWSFGV